MKKLLTACIFTGLLFTLSGCGSLGSVLNRYVSNEDTSAQDTASESPRVYMDELQGRIQDFTGNELTLLSDKEEYTFDVSQATLECMNGVVSGDEVSVIYEGQLTGTDTSQIRALKVVDEFNKKNVLEDRTAHGEVIGLTPNTITIRSRAGKTATYPITGTEQYYQNGIKTGNWVYLHFKGKFPVSQEENPMVLDASHLKVLSISDIDPLKVPDPTPTPIPEENSSQAEQEQQFHAVLQDIQLNTLTLLPDGADAPVSLDLSSLPVYFKGGAAPGSHVNVTYTGEFNGTTLEGITVIAVTGEDPEAQNERHITFTVSGTIVGSTADTATIETFDGALITCNTQSAENTSTGGLLLGSAIQVTFNPAQSKNSNIYTSIKIEDA